MWVSSFSSALAIVNSKTCMLQICGNVVRLGTRMKSPISAPDIRGSKLYSKLNNKKNTYFF